MPLYYMPFLKKQLYFSFFFFPFSFPPFLFFLEEEKFMKNNARDEQEQCGLNAKKQRVDGNDGADEEESTEIGGLSEG
jgi:hypothetical protein